MAASIFVGREGELAALEAKLAGALAGQGQILFVTGEAGTGKTALLQEFARRAQTKHGTLVAVLGNCNAFTGAGDPYLPFREILSQFTGDLDSKAPQASVSAENTRRLQALVARSTQILVDVGPALINVLIPGSALLSTAAQQVLKNTGALDRIKQLIQQKRQLPEYDPSPATQARLMEQYTHFLVQLAKGQPLLLILDDLQWVDAASAGLLFHLGRRIATAPILVLGAYRPDEVAPGHDAERHPLEKVLAEFRRYYGEIELDLAQAAAREGQRFVNALLGTLPNRLGDAFRQALYAHTDGHPLFTVELLRALQERGDLVRDEQNFWIAGPDLDWRRLPTRVEAVIEERIGRLEEQLHQMLSVASVEGEAFTAQVIARIQELRERQVLQSLSQELEKRHHLISNQGEVQIGRLFLSHYRFAHNVFQQYLYAELSAGERRLLHGEIAHVLEELYQGRLEEITVQLARHYAQAGEKEKAVEYLLQAGDWARRLSAGQEALGYYQQAMDLVEGRETADVILARRAQVLLSLFQGQAAARDYEQLLASAGQLANREQELEALLGLAQAYYVIALDDVQSDAIARVRLLGESAYALARELDDKRTMIRVLLATRWLVDFGRATNEEAFAHAEEALALSQELGDEELILECAPALIFALRLLDRSAAAEAQGEALLNRFAPDRYLPQRKEIYFELMWNHYVRGSFERCIACCDAAIKIARTIGVPPVQYPTLKALALLGLGRYDAAWSSLQQEIADEEHAFGRAFRELGAGLYFLELMAYAKASARFQHVIKEARRLGRVWMADWAQCLLVKSLIRSGQFHQDDLSSLAAGLTSIQAAPVIFEFSADADLAQCEIALATGRLDEALQQVEKIRAAAATSGRRLDQVAALELQIHVLLQLGRPDEALSLADSGIPIAESMNCLPRVWRLHAAKAQALATLGQDQMAGLEAQAAQEAIEKLAATIGAAELRHGFLNDPLVRSTMAAAQV